MRDFKNYILYEDKYMIVCHKPTGVPVQSAGTGTLDLEYACLNYLHGKNPGRPPFVGIVQRLDQPAEGLMALAKNKMAARELGKQVQDGRMEKTYLAVADGRVEPSKGFLEDWVAKDSKTRMGKAVTENTKGAKKAKLHYRVLSRSGEKSLLEIHLFTGRYHQIRIQFSHRGWPLAGDTKYNSKGGSRECGLGLCAYRLSLVHPASGKQMKWEIQPQGSAFVPWRDGSFLSTTPSGQTDPPPAASH